MKDSLKKILLRHLSVEEQAWLEGILLTSRGNGIALQVAFVAATRHIKKTPIALDPFKEKSSTEKQGFSIEGWTADQLARTFILLHLPAEDEEKYVNLLNTLFETAEMNELAILCSSLSLFNYPGRWLSHAKDAVRSNMGVVFDAIAFNNPYAAEHFDEESWNQMVLKSIFNGKSIRKITGLKARANTELARMVSDLAHERWAAGRSLSAEVLGLVAIPG